jgi:hypothetical protein
VAHDGVNTASDASDAGFEIINLAASTGGPLPVDFALMPITPNPSFGAVRIEYALPRDANVHLRIVDVQGREVARLVDGMTSAGRHQETWSGRIDGGRVRAGLYFVRLEAGPRVFTRRLAMAR